MLANFSNLITFSRGSNATVTDASGRLTYAANNLVTNSQDFEASAWTKTAASITANSAVAPDGTTTADTITEDTTAASAHRIFQTPANPIGPVIASVYVKAGTRSWFYIRLTDSASVVRYAYFNVSTGALGTVDAGITASITPAGNGWYRCSAFINAVNSTVCVFAITDANGNPVHNGNGTGTLFLWGAQLEAVTYQTTPSPYVSTSVANLLGFSEDFTNAAWTKVGAAIVPSAAQNPVNGLWSAQKLMETAVTSGHYISVSTVPVVSGATYTQSIYAKAGERSWIRLVFGTGFSTSNTWFNLANGTVGTVGAASASIQSVGNGWYRISVTQAATSTTNGQIFIAVETSGVSTSYTGDGNSGIYIYGAQLSNSGSLDPYVPTPGAAPSSTAYYGPRFDYDPVTLAAKGILIEEQRTNLLTYSETLNAAPWTNNGVSIVQNASTSPSGLANAAKVTENSANSVHELAMFTPTTGTAYAISFYAKAAGRSQISFSGGGFAAQGYSLIFDVSNGTIVINTGSKGTITPAGNGWYRCVVSFTTSNTVGFSLLLAVNTATTYQGDGTSGVLLWGAQIEAGAFATSYIPTVASQVTRTADVASITGSLFSQWYNQSEGTLVFNVVAASGLRGGSQGLFSVNNGTTSNVMNAARTNTRVARFNGTGSPDGDVSSVGTINDLATGKIAFTYKVNDWALSLNGAAAVTDATATVPLVTRFGIGSLDGLFDANAMWGGHIQNITYYPTRLTNDQLQAITK